MVDDVGEVLARFDGVDSAAGSAEALRLIAEGFGALMSVVVRFADDGPRVECMWAGGRYFPDPDIRMNADLLPTDTPVRSRRTPVAFGSEAFGAETAQMLRSFGGDPVLLVAPINDADEVSGAVAVLAEGADEFSSDARTALQLCGELLWRQIRHHESRRELHERVEVAEILTRIGGRLHGGGISEARGLLSEVFIAVGDYLEADLVATYERGDETADVLIEWPSDGDGLATPSVRFTDEEWDRIGEGPVEWSQHGSDPITDKVRGSHPVGMLVPGHADGRLVGLFVVAKSDNRPFRDAHRDLVMSTVGLLGQFRTRMAAELALVRRGVVEQCRTEIAEAFINSPASAIEEVVAAALQRIGEVFGVRRVRWVEAVPGAPASSHVVEWSDGSRPAAPERFTIDPEDVTGPGAVKEPFLIRPDEVAEFCGVESPSPTLVVPSVVGDDICAVLTLTGESAENALLQGEDRALTDLAGLVYQARTRAQQELDAEYRKTLDDLQLRLAHRFLDRTVQEDGPVLDWVLGELGVVLGCDLIAFAEYVGTSEGEMHWWSRGDSRADVLDAIEQGNAEFASYFERCLETGEPVVMRSRHLSSELRSVAETIVAPEVSLLAVPFRAPGVALLLGVCALEDRDWRAVEIALLQQVIGQMRQFIDVVAGRGRLEFDARHDALTGLANRRKMAEEFTSLVASGRRGALLMIDVDRFKVVNDSLGHSAGDAVLVAIADRVRASVREEDLVGRFGGDEFAVMVRDTVDDLELAATASRLIEIIREPILVSGTTVIPTCSIGIAAASEIDDVEAVLRHADAALYDAKARGRDRYEFFDDARRQSLSERLHLETALRSGVAAGHFVPWFQPEYDLISNRIVGVEALVRWNHPIEGVLDAYRFIDTAEEIGLAPELSRLVTRRSLETLRDWLDEGFDTRLRVNIAAAQLQSNDLADQIGESLDHLGIPPGLLCIEITERSLMLDLDSAVQALRAVRSLGVEVAVDDFGTGFSSLARLKHLPVDTLKIDRSFVSGLVTNETDREIVRTIIWLSRGLGLDVVAEGVEHPEQAELLLELGCRRAQGWLWSPAVPAAEVPRLARV
ncbi:MAG: bifunctional diguanylate cyclase/phosphodiesterase [Acidimicrobiales bacterium]